MLTERGWGEGERGERENPTSITGNKGLEGTRTVASSFWYIFTTSLSHSHWASRDWPRRNTAVKQQCVKPPQPMAVCVAVLSVLSILSGKTREAKEEMQFTMVVGLGARVW